MYGLMVGDTVSLMVTHENSSPPHPENAITLRENKETDYFSNWHWPVPAGEWRIVHGPCGFSGNAYNCGGYQEMCSFDIAPQPDAPKVMPVLAPYDGWVSFTGLLDEGDYPGVAASIEHYDGITSVYYQMTSVVVDTTQHVSQGDVIGYVDTSKDADSALHFFVQPNPVEHKCTPIMEVDFINEDKSTLASFNILWSMLTFTNPPPNLLNVLPPVIVNDVAEKYDTHIRITPNQRANIWIMLIGKLKNTRRILNGTDKPNSPIKQTEEGTLFKVSIDSYGSRAGYYPANFWPQTPSANNLSFSLGYEITRPINLIPNNGILKGRPKILQPLHLSKWNETPTFCWNAYEGAEKYFVDYRVRIAGDYQVDSHWMTDTCWHPRVQLPRGSYVWKVIARDEQGYMTPLHQMLSTFRIVSRFNLEKE